MPIQCKLSELPLKKTAVVVRHTIDSALNRRMLNLGVTEGAAVTPLFTSPFGDPTAYSVKGCVIALRRADCESVLVERWEEQDE